MSDESLDDSIAQLRELRATLEELRERAKEYQEKKGEVFGMIETKIQKAEDAFEEERIDSKYKWKFGLQLFARYVEVDFYGGDSLQITLKHRDEAYREDDGNPHFLYHEWGVTVSGAVTAIEGEGRYRRVVQRPTAFQKEIYRFVIDNFLAVCAAGFGNASAREALKEATRTYAWHKEDYDAVKFLLEEDENG